jgi:EVE domain
MTNWINTVSRDHVMQGVRGRFTQANHGKPHMLRRMAAGDWIVFYSPKTALDGGEPLQAFTAIGQVVDDEPYRAEMASGFLPWRRNVDFLPCTETPIRPLIDQLHFIEDKKRWGYKFRFGVFRIDDHDLALIRRRMTR